MGAVAPGTSYEAALEPLGQCPQMLDQLRRLVHLEVDTEHRDAQRQPPEVVVAGAVLAGVRVDRLDSAPVSGHTARDLFRGGP